MSTERPLRVQLWSYNYAPEPTGIGPVSTVLAHALQDRGLAVDVVAAHPHYPSPEWGTRIVPYRETRDGIPVLRLPLWIGRSSAAARMRQEVTFMTSQFGALPALGRPDVVVSASPSFPALLPAVVNARLRGLPWVLWLHDILPDGAASTGLLEDNWVLRASRWLERTAYEHADRIVVLSEAFTENLAQKGVPEQKIELIYDPATRTPSGRAPLDGPPRLLSMGNIGYSQGLTDLVRAFEARPEIDAQFVITGTGVAAEEARREIRTDRVKMVGLLSDEELEQELLRATIAFVSQSYEGAEFNIPSKLMNFMRYGLPVLAAVNPASEVAKLVHDANAGWVADSFDPAAFPNLLEAILADPEDLRRRAESSYRYAEQRFSVEGFGDSFARLLEEVAGGNYAGTRLAS